MEDDLKDIIQVLGQIEYRRFLNSEIEQIGFLLGKMFKKKYLQKGILKGIYSQNEKEGLIWIAEQINSKSLIEWQDNLEMEISDIVLQLFEKEAKK